MFAPKNEMLPLVGLVEAGDQIEHARFARAIGADQRVHRAGPDLELHVIDCGQSAEPQRQPVITSTSWPRSTPWPWISASGTERLGQACDSRARDFVVSRA